MLRIGRLYHQLSLLIVLWMASCMSLPPVVAESISEMISGYDRSLEAFVNERRYLCLKRKEIRGYYFAQHEPCQLTFFGNTKPLGITEKDTETDACNETQQIGESFFYWSRNASDMGAGGNISKEGGRGNASDWAVVWKEFQNELPIASLLLHFWPDACVGIQPRCFSLGNEKINSALQRLHMEGRFPQFPEFATHILVNCTSDSRKSFEETGDVAKVFDSIEHELSGYFLRFALTTMLICVTNATLGLYFCCCCLKTMKRQQRQLRYVQDGANPDVVIAVQIDGDRFVDDMLQRQGFHQQGPV